MRKSTTKSISWPFLIPALLVPLVGSLLYFVWLPGNALAQLAYTLTKVFTLVYPLFFIGWKNLFTQNPIVRWRSVFSWGLGSGLVICAAGTLLMLSPMGEMIWLGAESIREKAEQLGFTNHFLLFAVFISVFHSALEEFYWRGFVFGKLRTKLGAIGSHILAGLAFAAHHLVVTWQYFDPPLAILLALFVAIGGMIWTVLYQRQGTLVGCWLSHLCVDMLLMVVGCQLIFAS